MFKKNIIYCVLIIFLLSLIGCGTIQSFHERRESPRGGSTIEVASLLRFSDIPVPSNFKIDHKESYTFQTDTFRAGLLKYSGNLGVEEVAQFYKEQMARYNWRLINLIEYEKKLLNFEKRDQTCLVTIEGGMTRTTVIISLSPKSKEKSAAFSGKKTVK